MAEKAPDGLALLLGSSEPEMGANPTADSDPTGGPDKPPEDETVVKEVGEDILAAFHANDVDELVDNLKVLIRMTR